jgi:hypothetical protein
MPSREPQGTTETGNGGHNPYTLIPKGAFTASDMALGKLGTQSYVRLGNVWAGTNIVINIASGNPEEVNKIIISRAAAVGATCAAAFFFPPSLVVTAPLVGLGTGVFTDWILHQTPTQNEVIQGFAETYNYSSAVESALQEIVRSSQANSTTASQDASSPQGLSATAFARQIVSVPSRPQLSG